MQQLEFMIYPNRANAAKVVLLDSGVAINHTLVSRVIVWVGKTSYDSDVTPTMFDMSKSTHLSIQLGEADIVPGKYNCKLVIFDDAEYVDGYVWPVGFVAHVSPEPGPT